MRAIRDAYGMAPKQARRDALAFLHPHNEALRTYCGGLDLDPVAFYSAVHTNGPEWVRSRRIRSALEVS